MASRGRHADVNEGMPQLDRIEHQARLKELMDDGDVMARSSLPGKRGENVAWMVQVKGILGFVQAGKGDFGLTESILILQKWAQIPNDQREKASPAERGVISQLIANLKYHLMDIREMSPYISDEFAQKMIDMKEDEYNQYLMDFTDEFHKESENYALKYPRIGELSKILADLKHDDRELWNLMLEFFEKDRYRQSFKESISAVEGLKFYLNSYVDGENKHLKLNEVLTQLETNISKTIWYENMETFGRIVTAFEDIGKTDSRELYNKINEYMLPNFSMDYECDKMIDTLFKLSKTPYASKQLYEMMQPVIANGHYERYSSFVMSFFKPNQPFQLTENNMMKVMLSYGNGRAKYGSDLEMSPEFSVKMIDSIISICRSNQMNVSFPCLTQMSIFSGYSLRLDVREVKRICEIVADKSIAKLEGANELSEVADFIRNTVLPTFDEAIAARFFYKTSDALNSNRLLVSSASDLIGLANVYMSSGMMTESDQNTIRGQLDRYLKVNYGKLKADDTKAIRQMLDQIVKADIRSIEASQ